MPKQPSGNCAFPSPDHDHGPCLASAIERAKAALADKGTRLTPLRQKVLEEVAASHFAVGAYDVLERLSRKGRRIAPISVYRSLDALIDAGVIHKLESRNAFFACHSTHGERRRQVVLVCENCGSVAEINADAEFGAIEDAAVARGFHTRSALIEVMGLCAHCRSAAHPSAEHAGPAREVR